MDEDYDSAECIRAMVVAGYLISIAINSSLTLAYLPKQGARNVVHGLNNLFHIFHIETMLVNDGVIDLRSTPPTRSAGSARSPGSPPMAPRCTAAWKSPRAIRAIRCPLSREEITARTLRLIAYGGALQDDPTDPPMWWRACWCASTLVARPGMRMKTCPPINYRSR